jgi:hypothetical protein
MKTLIKSAGFSERGPMAVIMQGGTHLKLGGFRECIAFAEFAGIDPIFDLNSFEARLRGTRDQGLTVTRIRGELPKVFKDEIRDTLQNLVEIGAADHDWADRIGHELLR